MMSAIQICQLCLSFYPHQNISDRIPLHFVFVGDKMNCFFHQKTFPKICVPKGLKKSQASLWASMLFILQGFGMITDWGLDGETVISQGRLHRLLAGPFQRVINIWRAHFMYKQIFDCFNDPIVLLHVETPFGPPYCRIHM